MVSNLTSPKSTSDSTSWKMGPQIGISRSPCAGGPTSVPKMVRLMFSAGNFPPFLWEILVKSGTGCLRATDAGPCPRASTP